MPPKINLMGQRFGHLIVVSPAENIGGRVAWRCQCDCGGEVVTTRNSLRSGETQTCGCGKGSKLELTGQRFGRLVAVRMTGRSRKQDALWLCRCDCGVESSKAASDLNRGRIRSCGCIQREEQTRRMTVHGHHGHPLRGRWLNMLARTSNPKHKSFDQYGGRGITVCERWQTFENFVADMESTFDPELTLDRIDVNGNYEPGNCRWATQLEQQRNRRTNRTIEWGGTSMILTEWGELLGLNPGVIGNRLRAGWTVDRALSTGADSETLARLSTDPAA